MASIEEMRKKLRNKGTIRADNSTAAQHAAAVANFTPNVTLPKTPALPTVSEEKTLADFNNYLSTVKPKQPTSLLATPELTQTVQNFAQERVQNAAQKLEADNGLSMFSGRAQDYGIYKNTKDTERQLANAQEMRDTYANLYGSGTTTTEQKRDALEQKNKFDSEVETLSKRLAALRAQGKQNDASKYTDLAKSPDYDIYSALGAEMRKPQTQSTGDTDLDAYLKQIKANADKANAGTQVKEVESKDLMGYMNKTEEGTYNYLLGKFGQNMADSYFNSIEDSLKQRQGGEIAKTLADEQGLARAVQTGGFGLRAGFDQFGSGIRQLGSEEAVSPTSVGYGSQAVRESLADAGPNVLGSSLGQTAYDLVTTTGNMLPSILVSTFAGPAAGTATMGLSAGGNAYTQGLEMGYTPEQARNYATLVGASEGLLQYFLGGIGKLGGKTGLSAKLGGKIAQIENGLARFSANFGKNILSEATEEGLQAILEPMFRQAITGEDSNVDWSEVAYNALLGGLSGGLMGGNAQTNVDTNANTPAVPTAQRDAAVKASLMGQGMSEAKADAILPTVMRVINGDTTLSNNELVKGMPIADARVKAVINQYTGGSIDINETSLGKLKSQYRAVIEANAPGQGNFDAGADAANAASVSATAEQTGTEGENMTLENGGEKNYNEVKQNEMEGMTDGTETGRSESGSGDRQRAYSVAASEPGSGVQSGTGSPEARRAASQQRGENFRNNAEAAGIQEVSTASFGIPGGTDTKSVRVLTEQLWDDGLRAIYADQQSKGRDVTFVVGAMEFEDADGAYTVRGAISEDGNKMWIRADHADLTPEQIVAHEEFHGLQMSDPELVARTVAQIDADYEGALRALAEAYVDEYGWTDVSDDYVFEEILCDAYAGIDIFDYIGGSNIYQFADTARNMAAQSQAAINEARGTSKYSIESLPDGKKYVRAERQVIFGNDPEAWGEQVERYINKEIREGKDVQLIAEDGDILTLTADTAGKAKYRYKPNGQPMTNEEYETKLNAEAHIDELALVSRRGKRTADDYGGVHGDMASRGWNYRTVFFRDFDGKYYRLYISVAQGADGNVVYHIGNIEERSFPNVIGSSAKNDGALKGKASSDARLPREGKNVNSKFSRDTDRSYMNAVDSGDTEAAQRMVDAAAEAAMPNSKIRGKDGKLLPVYHGTTEMFNVFDTSIKGGTNGTAEGFGIYTSDDTAVTSNYGQRQLKLYANIEKPATDTKKTITAVKLAKLIEDTCKREAEVIVEEGYDNINDAIKDTWISNYVNTYNMPMSRAYRDAAYGILRFSDSDLEVIQEVMSGMGIRDYEAAYDFYHNSLIPVTGFDGFITHWDNKDNSQIILAIDSRQLKYADPVTYDDDGNVIPLSERFNSENDDIRYSRDPIRKERTAQEREKLQSTLEAVRSAAPETFEERRRSTNNSPVDNTETEAYNEINNDKEGQSYVQTDEFRQLQEESARLLESNSGRGYGLSVDEEGRIRVAGVLQRELESRRRGGGDSQWATVTLGDSSNPQRQYNMLEDVDGQTFRDFFEIARRYTGNGELVDLHNTETTEDGIGYDDCYNYLSEDGLSGFSITSDGDLISVFNAKDINGKGGFLKAIAPLVKERASTLDCFASPNQNLVQMYEKAFGFKTASVMDYNMEYDHDNIAANHNMPQVAFMVNSNTDVETRHFTEDQWDEAKAYQMQKAEEAQRDNRAYELFRDSSPRYSMSLEGDEAAERGRGNIRPEDVRLKRTMEAFRPKPKEVTPERELTPEEQLRLERTMDAFRPKGTPSRYAPSEVGVGAAEAGFTNAEPTRTAPTQSRGVTNSNWMDEQTKRAAAPKAHEVISEANSLAGAKQYIYTDEAGNIVNFEDSVKNLLETDGWGPKESDAAMLLMQEAAKRKNWDDVRSLATRYNEVGTKSAQALQARKKWVGETPEDRIVGILRAVDKLQKQYGDRKAQKGVEINISDELLDEYYAAKDDAARDAVIVKMQNDVASKIKPSLMDKWTALRYVNMLGNFKTQGRNLLGNTFMAGLSFAQNEFATLGEVIANAATGGKVGRTKSAFVGRDWMQAAKADYDNVKSALLAGGKYNDRAYTDDFTEGVEDARRIFDSKLETPLEAYRELTNWAMEGGDRIFAKSAYARALAGYLKANGVTAEQLDAGAVSEDMMDAAREYAINRAQQQTFRDNNAFSTWVSRIGRRADTPKAARAITEGLAPFRKTPANVMVRAMEYSPLGLVETAVKAAQAKSGKEGVSGTDVVDSLSKNLTGAGLMALGFMLSELGVLNSGADEEDQSVDQMINKQAYSINLPNGATYTIDWAAPASLILFMGATMQELASDEDLTFKDLEYVFTSMADPMIEMSMLSGINDTLDGIKYADNNIMQMVCTLAVGYLTQGLTNTFIGQIERTAEPNRMKTYVDAESGLPDWLQRNIGKASAKIRGWDYNQTEYLDEFGNPESNGSVVRRAFENFVSPGYYEESNRDKPAYAFAEWAHDTLGKDYFPEAYVDSKTDYDNETYTLTQEEKDRWQATRGGIAEGYLEAASQNEAFAALPAELQKSVLAQLKTNANAAAKSEMLANRGIEEDIGDATVSERELSAAEAVDYQIYKKTFNQLNEAKNQSAENISAMGKLMEDFDSLSPATQELLMDTEGFSKYYDSLEAGISTKDYYAVKTAVSEAPVPAGYKTQPNWNKDMTVVSMDIPEEEKLAAIKLTHNGDSTADKYQLAYNEGIALEDIVAYYALCQKRVADEDEESSYRTLTNSERRREAREQGIDAYSKLERIWGYDKDTLARKLG